MNTFITIRFYIKMSNLVKSWHENVKCFGLKKSKALVFKLAWCQVFHFWHFLFVPQVSTPHVRALMSLSVEMETVWTTLWPVMAWLTAKTSLMRSSPTVVRKIFPPSNISFFFVTYEISTQFSLAFSQSRVQEGLQAMYKWPLCGAQLLVQRAGWLWRQFRWSLLQQ